MADDVTASGPEGEPPVPPKRTGWWSVRRERSPAEERARADAAAAAAAAKDRAREEAAEDRARADAVAAATVQPEPPGAPLTPAARRRLRRRRRGRIACLVGMLLGAMGLVAGRLGVLWIAFDVFAQFTLHFAVVLIAFLIGYLMPRARVLTAITLIVLAVVAIGVWPIWSSTQPRGSDRLGTNERPVRLMSFNTRLKNHNADAVADEILRVDPDIAVLVEFGEEKRSALDKLRARYPYQADCMAKENCYLAIIAKAPLADVETRGIWEGPPLVKASFGPEYGNLTVVGIHTLRFPHQASHLRQIGALALYLEALGGAKVVAGDFNATPFSRILSTFGDRSHLNRLTNLPSWPSQLQLPQLAIDHIFAGRGVRAIEAPRIGRNAGSDHYPVIVGLAVGGQ